MGQDMTILDNSLVQRRGVGPQTFFTSRSAPSERVFSTAGLTIAKDHTRLASEMANELIFLHDALPAIRNFYKSGRQQG
jgi:hypothetical protein